jgi:hypothetical protein
MLELKAHQVEIKEAIFKTGSSLCQMSERAVIDECWQNKYGHPRLGALNAINLSLPLPFVHHPTRGVYRASDK